MVAGLVIAAIKVTFVVVIFMGLGHSSALVRVAAAAGVFWLAILFVLTLTDVIASRPRALYSTGMMFGNNRFFAIVETVDRRIKCTKEIPKLWL